MPVRRRNKREDAPALGAFEALAARASRRRPHRDSVPELEESFEELLGRSRTFDCEGRPRPTVWSHEEELCGHMDFERFLSGLPKGLMTVAALLSQGYGQHEISRLLKESGRVIRARRHQLARLLTEEQE
ncbi:MAG: hypothetical protein HY319_17265 [Armatimonadetes bacterium]|nr:hypothetical protein [Armatimonadota bacterium]